MSAPSSFFNQNATVYTDTNPAGPADTPVTSESTEAPSSFYKGTGAQLTAATLIGLTAFAAVPHNFLTGITSEGVWTYAQPSFSDLLGVLDPSLLPDPFILTPKADSSPTSSSSLTVDSYDTGSGGTNTNVFVSIDEYNNDGFGDGLSTNYSRGTKSAQLAVQNGDVSFNLQSYFYNGATAIEATSIVSTVDGPFTSGTAVPGRLAFSTTPAGGTPTERLRIDSNGNVIIGGFSIVDPGGTLGAAKLQSVSDHNWELALVGYGGTHIPAQYIYRTNAATPTGAGALLSTDEIGGFVFAGDDGTGTAVASAAFGAFVDGAVSAGNLPAYLSFATGSTNFGYTERLRIDSNGFLTTGGVANIPSLYGINPNLELNGNSATLGATLALPLWTTTTGYSQNILFTRSNSNTIGTHVAVVADDKIGFIGGTGSDGTGFNGDSWWILGRVDGTVAANSVPGRIEFATTSVGAQYAVERLRIDSTGKVGIGLAPLPGQGVFQVLPNSTPSGTSLFTIDSYDSGSGGTNSNIFAAFGNFNNDGYGDGLYLAYGRGTRSVPLPVQTNDLSGLINFSFVWDVVQGAYTGASIAAYVDSGTISSTSHPTGLEFSTTPNGSISPQSRLHIDSAGLVGVGANGSLSTFATSSVAPIFIVADVSDFLGLVGGPTSGSHFDVGFYATGTGTDTNCILQVNNFNVDAFGDGIDFTYARGTKASPTIVQNGDNISNITFGAFVGAGLANNGYGPAVVISANVDGLASTTSMPGRLGFFTQAVGTIDAPVERLRITSSGNVGFNGTPDLLTYQFFSGWSPTGSVGFASYDSGSGGTNGNLFQQIYNFNNDGYGDAIYLTYGRGTRSATLAAQSGDQLLGLTWGYVTVNGQSLAAVPNTARIYATVDGVPSVSSAPGAIHFDTTAAGSTSMVERLRIDSNGNVIVNTAALATTATDGFLYLETCAGTPTGVPTSYTGRSPTVYDTTNNVLWHYNSGWKDVAALAVTNDTNVTGAIASHRLTLGWTGTLAAARLNSSVVQGVTNDTNITGSILAQNLTLGWTGTLGVSRGGIGVGTLASNGVLYGNATSAVQATAQGAANTILTANAGAPSFSATPTIGTSLTCLLLIGGTGASSTLTLESTSGIGTSDFIAFKTGSQSERMRIDTNGLVGIGVTPSHLLDLKAGTTSIAPVRLASGTNLTTAVAGAMEFDGTCFYSTAVASARQVVDCEQLQCLSGTRTFTNNTSAQAIFNATANGAITLAGSTTYDFEMLVAATGFSSSAHTINFGFGGTATLTSIGYQFSAQSGSTLATPTAALTGFIATATASAVIASSTTTGLNLYVRGTIRVNAGGTVIPQLTQVTASAAAVVQANSFFRCWPVGSNAVTNVGNWS